MKEAAKAYEGALALREEEDLRARLAFMLADNGEPARARAELDKLAARESKLPAVWSTLGRLAYEAKEWPAAEKAYARASSLKDDGRIWFNLAVVRVRLQDLSGALQAFERAAQHADVKQQAEAEAGRIREAMRPQERHGPPDPPGRVCRPHRPRRTLSGRRGDTRR